MTDYNYGVIMGGIYKTRHDAVGAAAILNREKPVQFHRVVTIPNVIGAATQMHTALEGVR